jgi:membrane-anchored glycerophosphoryl diester phosphodiesterase (GDPDase)
MKLDMGQAWSQAVAMMSANRDLIAIVAGVFFFLPYLALMLMLPDMASQMPVAQPGTDPQVVFDALIAIYARIWPYLLAVVILQGIGSLALLALLRDSTRPTLGEALKLGFVAFLPYLAAQLVAGVGIGVVVALLVGGAAAINQALAVLVMLLVFVGVVYVAVKLSLTMPVIGIERVYNPITALARSWRLTKGNSLRLFFFYFLIIVAGVIVVSVLQMIFGLVFALFGAQGQLIGDGIVASILNAAWAVVFLAILAAAHNQLAGPSESRLADVFE